MIYNRELSDLRYFQMHKKISNAKLYNYIIDLYFLKYQNKNMIPS